MHSETNNIFMYVVILHVTLLDLKIKILTVLISCSHVVEVQVFTKTGLRMSSVIIYYCC